MTSAAQSEAHTIIHVFENIPHHYHNFMHFFAKHATGNGFPPLAAHSVYVQTSGDSDVDAQNQQALATLGIENVNVYSCQKTLLRALKAESGKAEFVFHSMLCRWLWLRLFLSSINARSHWVCWGADLYQHILNEPTFKQRVAKQIQSWACQRMRSVKCLNPGDARLLTQVLGRTQVDVLPYPLVGVSAPDSFMPFAEGEELSLLLGNSAAQSNNHIELIDAVSPFAQQAMKAYMPLNYAGSPEYVEQVIKYGKEQLGEAFIPITDMLSKSEYDQLLASIDGAVFAHNRQQGLYVAYYMMLHGKKLFLKDTTSTFENFQHYGFHIESLRQLSHQEFEKVCSFDDSLRTHNQSILMSHFTEQALGRHWGKFFSDIKAQSCR